MHAVLAVFAVLFFPLAVFSSPIGTAHKTITILQLPDDFDRSHPALDIEAQIALLEADPSAILPQLPDDLPYQTLNISLSDNDKLSDEANPGEEASALGWSRTVQCSNWDGPYGGYIAMNADKLNKVKNQMCCQTLSSPGCKLMARSFSAATEICGDPGRCIPCGWAANSNMEILKRCKVKNAAGGLDRYNNNGKGWVDITARRG